MASKKTNTPDTSSSKKTTKRLINHDLLTGKKRKNPQQSFYLSVFDLSDDSQTQKNGSSITQIKIPMDINTGGEGSSPKTLEKVMANNRRKANGPELEKTELLKSSQKQLDSVPNSVSSSSEHSKSEYVKPKTIDGPTVEEASEQLKSFRKCSHVNSDGVAQDLKNQQELAQDSERQQELAQNSGNQQELAQDSEKQQELAQNSGNQQELAHNVVKNKILLQDCEKEELAEKKIEENPSVAAPVTDLKLAENRTKGKPSIEASIIGFEKKEAVGEKTKENPLIAAPVMELELAENTTIEKPSNEAMVIDLRRKELAGKRTSGKLLVESPVTDLEEEFAQKRTNKKLSIESQVINRKKEELAEKNKKPSDESLVINLENEEQAEKIINEEILVETPVIEQLNGKELHSKKLGNVSSSEEINGCTDTQLVACDTENVNCCSSNSATNNHDGDMELDVYEVIVDSSGEPVEQSVNVADYSNLGNNTKLSYPEKEVIDNDTRGRDFQLELYNKLSTSKLQDIRSGFDIDQLLSEKETIIRNSALWVSGLSKSTTASHLMCLFSLFGEVLDVKVVAEADPPHSQFYAYILMGSEQDATKCMKRLQNEEFNESRLRIKKTSNDLVYHETVEFEKGQVPGQPAGKFPILVKRELVKH